MMAILGVCGFALGGMIGLILVPGFAAFSLLGASRATAALVLKMYQATHDKP